MALGNDGYNRSVTSSDAYNQQPDGRATLYNQTYVGFVRKSEDDLRMGRLKVWIPELGGDSDVEETWYTVNYCSPFAGATPITKFDNQPANRHPEGNKKDGTKMDDSQLSYGWWAVPPDIDTEVIVMFVNGDSNKGIWIGCLYKQYMNHMVPGIPRNNSYDEGESGELPPVVEYNKRSEVGNNLDPTRPRYDPLHYGLKMQGLYTDPQRGPASSGARRESPSKVFGFLTPDGSQIYADDLECNQFIRLRTKTGVQVLIHETDGYVYMNSKRGNSWLQISDDGIDMYSTKGVNIHSTGGYNFHTDKDYNLHIGGSFNVFTEGDFKVSTVGNVDFLAGKDMKQDIGGAFHSTIKQNRNVEIEGADSLKIKGNSTTHSDKILTLSSGDLIVFKSQKITQNNSDDPNGPEVPAEAEGAEPSDMKDRKLQETYPDDQRKSITQRMPTHEPYDEHPSQPPVDGQDPQAGQQNKNNDQTSSDQGTQSGSNNQNNSSGQSGDSQNAGGQNSTTNASSGVSSATSAEPNKAGTKPLLDLVGKTEGTDKGDGYNETLAYGALTGGDVNLTGMTLNEVDALQTKMLNHPDNQWNSSAVGRYQITRTTMRGLRSQMGLTGDELYSPALQDSMATRLMQTRGLNAWQSGRMSDAQFMNNLSLEWASLPRADGSGSYDQRVGTTASNLQSTLNQMRANPVNAAYQEVLNEDGLIKQENQSLQNVAKIISANSVGSGVLTDNSGTIITNAHVVGVTSNVGDYFNVEIGNSIRRAVLVRINPSKDIAQLRLTEYKDLTPITTGGELKIGDVIYSYGFALGKTFTKVVAIYNGENNKQSKYVDPGSSADGLIVSGLSVMQTVNTLGLKPGMSGGPILDAKGRLIGINAATVSGTTEARFIPL